MSKFLICFLFTLLLLSSGLSAQKLPNPLVTTGVSLSLAKYRKAMISDIQYKIHFNIPADKSADILANEEITFNLEDLPPLLQLDFKQDVTHIKSVSVNGKPSEIRLEQEHLIIDKQHLRKSSNNIAVQFIAGNESLNRNSDYLYALFVPDHARTVFPCFDQPDLKARFLLSLTVPKDWKVLANGNKKDSIATSLGNTYSFDKSDLLPTYLFSFAAGKFSALKKVFGNRSMEFLHRETDDKKLRLSVDSVFIAHKDAIQFLENWTSIPFPFKKIGFAAIPDFQFGGMEHPGEVQYKSSALFLDEGATRDQFISRSNLISHETAHMWFGDLVTMRWFNDVWMKEVFANFMADKVTENLMGKNTFDLKFLQDHYPAAYGIDRTAGANPIRQELDNLQDAGSMYGNIIYHKAPIMMRQLEQIMGKENFQKGIREYLKKYSYNNADWTELIAILNKYSKTNLEEWNKVWVNLPGRPVFNYNINYQENKISSLTISQKPESGNARIWPQLFSVKLFYPTYSKTISVNIKNASIDLIEAKGLAKPSFVLFNADGMGYGIFPEEMMMLENFDELKSPLERASVYINAYENTLAGKSLDPKRLLRFLTIGLSKEQNEMNLRLLTGYLTSLYWNFTRPSDRLALSKTLEDAIWQAMEHQTAPNNKKILFNTYQNIYLSASAAKKIYNIWETQTAPVGVKLIDEDYTGLALSIALKADTAKNVLNQQLQRITNTDRKARLMFLIPALSSVEAVRDSFFFSLKERKNRAKESFVTTALSYLHHPLRQNTSIKYLPESLKLLEEIQKTGDIFFPQSWLSATFGSYQSAEAEQVVTDFLKTHPGYNPKLKDKILQSTDNLFKAKKLLKN
ncbi:M1 family aminopeptidase [Pedobacter sp. Leaf194]|uniref:M1 family metallopeptidase n=1 Tax=Pedobacter sp. Leaf194 TaxID=1736297 RepID=UPI000702DF32|nr:M1 family aminopeptidase [Pedobacter sp. Leaf194]KQS34479.1 aminopeptidase [Pedobacter sp. Leaf194]